MSAAVKLASVLPADNEVNGLDHIRESLIEDPTRKRFGIIVFTTRAITETVETHFKRPTIEIERIEYAGDVSSVSQAIREELITAAEHRLGHEPLPYDSTDPEERPKVTYELDDHGTEPIFGDDDYEDDGQ